MFPARYPVEPPSRPAVDHVALADQIAKRNAPQVDRDVGPNDKLFAMFAYTGDGEGGGRKTSFVPGRWLIPTTPCSISVRCRIP